MDKSPSLSRITSGDELADFVLALRKAVAVRYEQLAIEMAKIGEPKLETIYRSLAGDARQRGALDEGSARSAPKPENIDIPEVARLWTPYAVWAFAVSNEIHFFETLASANVPIDSSRLRSALAIEARACLDRAANYRVQRRLAFHAERISEEIAQFPDIRRIDTVEDFAHVALAIERYFRLLVESHEPAASGLGAVAETGESAIAYLEPVARAADMSNRLRNPLKRLAKVSPSQVGGTVSGDFALAKIALEADRIFDYYDRVFETAQDQQVVEASQHLSTNALDRLRNLRALQDEAGYFLPGSKG